jgi:hypothetical protein
MTAHRTSDWSIVSLFLIKEIPMNAVLNRSILFTSFGLAGLALSACQTDKHTMVEPAPGTRIVCRQCYTEIEKVRADYGPRWGVYSGQDRIIKRHQCPDCRTEMSIYTEDGVFKVKCARCAPEGLACDKCLPPEGTAQ